MAAEYRDALVEMAGDELERLREALKDIAYGATMMQGVCEPGSMRDYVCEVQRVAMKALRKPQ